MRYFIGLRNALLFGAAKEQLLDQYIADGDATLHNTVYIIFFVLVCTEIALMEFQMPQQSVNALIVKLDKEIRRLETASKAHPNSLAKLLDWQLTRWFRQQLPTPRKTPVLDGIFQKSAGVWPRELSSEISELIGIPELTAKQVLLGAQYKLVPNRHAYYLPKLVKDTITSLGGSCCDETHGQFNLGDRSRGIYADGPETRWLCQYPKNLFNKENIALFIPFILYFHPDQQHLLLDCLFELEDQNLRKTRWLQLVGVIRAQAQADDHAHVFMGESKEKTFSRSTAFISLYLMKDTQSFDTRFGDVFRQFTSLFTAIVEAVKTNTYNTQAADFSRQWSAISTHLSSQDFHLMQAVLADVPALSYPLRQSVVDVFLLRLVCRESDVRGLLEDPSRLVASRYDERCIIATFLCASFLSQLDILLHRFSKISAMLIFNPEMNSPITYCLQAILILCLFPVCYPLEVIWSFYQMVTTPQEAYYDSYSVPPRYGDRYGTLGWSGLALFALTIGAVYLLLQYVLAAVVIAPLVFVFDDNVLRANGKMSSALKLCVEDALATQPELPADDVGVGDQAVSSSFPLSTNQSSFWHCSSNWPSDWLGCLSSYAERVELVLG